MTTTQSAIQKRVERIQSGNDPEWLLSLPSGHAILAKYQPPAVRGACMLLPDPVVSSPNDLKEEERGLFFRDLILLGDAILEVTQAERINYLVLCNQVPELHGHCIPRFAQEEKELRLMGPFEAYDFSKAPVADARGADFELHEALRQALERRLAAREQPRSSV